MKFLHNLLLSWIDSLKVFTFNNLKLNFLIILKTFKDAIKNITKPAYAAYLLLELLFCILFSSYINRISLMEELFLFLMFSLFVYTIKPSVERVGTKIWFLHLMLFQLLCILISFLIRTALISLVFKLLYIFSSVILYLKGGASGCPSCFAMGDAAYALFGFMYIFMFNMLSFAKGYTLISVYSFTSPLILFLVFFLLDSKKSLIQYLKAFLRAFLMFLYNYPCCFIAYNILWLLIKLDTGLIAKFFPGNTIIETIVTVFNILILFFIYTIFLMNFYINQIHTKFDLYYKSRYVKL